MTSGQRALTGEKHDQFPGTARGLSSGMVTYCPCCDYGAAASRSRTEAEVRVLAVHEKGRIEAMKIVPDLTLYQHKRSGNDRNEVLFIGVGGPWPRRFGIENPAARQKRAEAEREAKRGPWAGLPPPRTRVDRTVFVDKTAANNARRRMVASTSEQFPDGVRCDSCVWVQEQQPASSGDPGPGLATACESAVLSPLDDPCSCRRTACHGYRVITGSVIDEDHLG